MLLEPDNLLIGDTQVGHLRLGVIGKVDDVVIGAVDGESLLRFVGHERLLYDDSLIIGISYRNRR